MGLVEMVQARDAVDSVCKAVDAGQIHPTEQEMYALAELVSRTGGPLAHDLLVKLASRSLIGRAALKDIAQ